MIVTFLVIIGILGRLIPHAPNFTPLGAVTLFGGTYLPKRIALVLPLATMLLSDLFIGFDSWSSRLTVYGSFLLIGCIGLWLRTHKSTINVVLASLLSSILFFLITNTSVWAFSDMYAKTLDGLLLSYTLAIPFFRNTLTSDLLYTAIFFGSYEFAMYLRKRTLRLASL